MTDLVEVLAQALMDHDDDPRAILRALEAAGYRVVPYVCTDSMRAEGKIALREDYKAGGITKIWWAMLDEYAEECKPPVDCTVD